MDQAMILASVNLSRETGADEATAADAFYCEFGHVPASTRATNAIRAIIAKLRAWNAAELKMGSNLWYAE